MIPCVSSHLYVREGFQVLREKTEPDSRRDAEARRRARTVREATTVWTVPLGNVAFPFELQ